ncbi:TPA: hypothetical protein DF272_00165 [Candidatus Falkowbacteria bacterium]|nr:hypothetical protein [Candidatus Falkowbacteria bacterium]
MSFVREVKFFSQCGSATDAETMLSELRLDVNNWIAKELPNIKPEITFQVTPLFTDPAGGNIMITVMVSYQVSFG